MIRVSLFGLYLIHPTLPTTHPSVKINKYRKNVRWRGPGKTNQQTAVIPVILDGFIWQDLQSTAPLFLSHQNLSVWPLRYDTRSRGGR